MNLFLITLSSLICVIHTASFPEKWERCKFSPSTEIKRYKCIERTMSNIIDDLAKNGGNTDLKMGSLDPFKVNSMTIGQSNQNSPVKLALHYKNLNLYGLKNAKVKRVSGKVSSAEGFYLKFELHMPTVVMVSDYKIDGSILILPITGSGKTNTTYIDVTAISEVHGKSDIRDGKEYLKITNNNLLFNIKGMTLYMDNLFNGNKALGDSMNAVMNENWKVLYQELKPSMEAQLSKNIVKYCNKILETIEYKELFLSE